ncbi:protein translocase subunit SecF [Sporichthya sp.]|uniref:protein translocase subunit SecF n=1 Tax=Sporichthya sp. TaxID=65475 RepID=UPI00185CCADC|nr:protein translocase subunit SecF [Sporichthya sp.]MBA3742942.1 protein translocase subunit SecF [Sporichthya sp.]
MSRWSDLGHDLQTGAKSVDIIDRRKTWFLVSAVLVLISILGLGVRQLDMGVEFDGGSVFEVKTSDTSVGDVRDIVEGAGVEEPKVQKLGSDRYRIETTSKSTEEARPVQDALSKELGLPLEEITTQVVGPSWGDDVTSKALRSLLIFLALLTVYLAMAFAPKMAAGAMVALLHDLVITIGIYALVGFTVSPATVIGLLTILGYSLYDTVVVFDKVRENTADLTKTNKMTYSQAANLAVNQTLVRSINTTVIALLPVGGLLFVGAGLLGAGTLKDLALVLFVGMAVGAYSSIFLATPAVVALKEREPEMKALTKRVASREAALRKSGGKSATEGGAGGGAGGGVALAAPPEQDLADEDLNEDGTPRTPGERVQPKRGPSREQRQKKRP